MPAPKLRKKDVCVDDGWTLPAEVAVRPAKAPASPAPSATLHDDLDDGWALPTELVSSIERPTPTGDEPAFDFGAATRDELLALSGIGPRLADRIVDYRNRAPVRCADDLLGVQGIGPKLLARILAGLTR